MRFYQYGRSREPTATIFRAEETYYELYCYDITTTTTAKAATTTTTTTTTTNTTINNNIFIINRSDNT